MEQPVKADENEPFLCWTIIQFIAALSLQIALKVQHLYNVVMKYITCEKHLHGNWSHIAAKSTNSCQQTPPYAPQQTLYHVFLPELPPS
jgi:hypothetical protein